MAVPVLGSSGAGSLIQKSLTISAGEFQQLRDFIYDRFGIHLSDEKKSLVVSRLQKDLQDNGFGSFKQYYEHLLTAPTQEAFSNLINRISTNYSFFYREKAHFDFFVKTVLPEVTARLSRRNSNDIRFWCAGCSTCEEPYTIVMLMLEYFGMEYQKWDAGILATDISDKVLQFARKGLYPEGRVCQLPKGMQARYFSKNGTEMAVKERVKKEVVIRRFNLMNTFPFKKTFQIIFCRNVMIYFDQKTRDKLIKKYYDFLEPGGYFFIGHSETIPREQGLFEYVQPALYRKPL